MSSRNCPLSIVKPEETIDWGDKYSYSKGQPHAYCITDVTDVREYLDTIMDSAYTPYSYKSVELNHCNSLYTSDISGENTPDMENFNFDIANYNNICLVENISNKSYGKKICDTPTYKESKELFCLAYHKHQMHRILQELKHRVTCAICGEGKDHDKLDSFFCSSICEFIAKNNM